MDLSTSLLFYKQQKIRDALVAQAVDKEVSVMLHGNIFGKRPDVLSYANDVLELAKKKASSFHCSEELWFNPLSIRTGMKRHELDELRRGWDLILDIDCPDWELSKLTTYLFIKALQHHGITCISVKFSGNKGFHIAVPFEAFPDSVPVGGEIKLVRHLFPEGPRAIASYLLSFIQRNYISIDSSREEVSFDKTHKYSFKDLEKVAGLSGGSLFQTTCPSCNKRRDFAKEKITYQCAQCGHISKPVGTPEVLRCEKCSYPVHPQTSVLLCKHCGSSQPPQQSIDITAVVEVDTILIASRHLYRMPFSLHEKSGLVSIPIPLDEVLTFDKKIAQPKNISSQWFVTPFLDRSKVKLGEAALLFREAFDHEHHSFSSKKILPKVEIPKEAIPQDFFPPCIQNIQKGLEDGKKRALFILINFLRSVGWNKENITTFVYDWNEQNPQPLREQYLKGQLSQIKQQKKILPPPSCANTDYYKSLLICQPDDFCPRIKNPAQYAKRKSELGESGKRKKQERVSFVASQDISKQDAKQAVGVVSSCVASSQAITSLLGTYELDCFGRQVIDILIESSFPDKTREALVQNGFTQHATRGDELWEFIFEGEDEDFKKAGLPLYCVCQLILVQTKSHHAQTYKQVTAALKEAQKQNSDIFKEYLALKKHYDGKTLRAYTKSKTLFFRKILQNS